MARCRICIILFTFMMILFIIYKKQKQMESTKPPQDLDEAFVDDSSGFTASVPKNLTESLWDDLMAPRRTESEPVVGIQSNARVDTTFANGSV